MYQGKYDVSLRKILQYILYSFIIHVTETDSIRKTSVSGADMHLLLFFRYVVTSRNIHESTYLCSMYIRCFFLIFQHFLKILFMGLKINIMLKAIDKHQTS